MTALDVVLADMLVTLTNINASLDRIAENQPLRPGPSPDSSVAAFDHRMEVAAENARRDLFFEPKTLADHADDAIELTGGER